MRNYLNILLMVFAVSITGVAVTGCNDDGAMENAGESMDDAMEETKDAMTPDGEMEEAGESMDDAMSDDN